MLAVGTGHRHDQGVVADLAVLAAPGRHVGHGVGPADAHAAVVGGQPAVGAAAHPVVVVAQGHHAHAVLLGQLTGTVHGALGVQRAETAMAVPPLQRAEGGHAGGAGRGVDLALFQVADHPGEAVQAVAEDAGQAVLGEDDGGILGVLVGKAFLFQHAGKLGYHGFIGNTFHNRAAPFVSWEVAYCKRLLYLDYSASGR